MDNLARKIDRETIQQRVGTVVADHGTSWSVRTRHGETKAARATSCLVRPRVGDAVLLVEASAHGSFVLAVLRREPAAGAEIVADGDLAIELCEGRLSVTAAEGVSVVSGKDASVLAATVGVRAVEGNVVLERLSYFGSLLSAELGRVKAVAQSFDAVFERVTQRLQRSYRFVAEFEQLRAGRIDHAADKNLTLRAENTIVTARQLVKVDGEQIHLG